MRKAIATFLAALAVLGLLYGAVLFAAMTEPAPCKFVDFVRSYAVYICPDGQVIFSPVPRSGRVPLEISPAPLAFPRGAHYPSRWRDGDVE